ncbi:cytokine-like nuclear factor N-PAC isoform X1 [Tachypleus tridentatus]|uniref:cytokine-like nuclear factor N-PAC isoform X1 n=1 Tax=Tachypleus tridentatus TaxID=6853 RepID=UPI003FCF9EBD
MAYKFTIGDPVWAKMKGFSPWPGKIAFPAKEIKRPALKKPMHCIYFFGTKDYAWILEENIKPYHEFREEFMQKNRLLTFKDAVGQAEEYVKSHPELKSPRIEPNLTFEKKEHVQPQKVKEKTSSSKKPRQKRALSDSSNTSSVSTKKKRSTVTRQIADEASGSAFHVSSSSTSPVENYYTHVNSSPSKYTGLLSRPSYVNRPVTPPLDVENVSDTLKQKNVKASDLKFGFLGLGIMGQGIVKNLLNSGHTVTIWNRTPRKCRDFVEAGAIQGQTPSDVVAASDITFSCVSDPQAAKELVFGNCGVLKEMKRNKGYVEMTSVDPETSQDIAEAIQAQGGRYLEAPVLGSKKPAEEGMLIILAAGDKSVFDDCTTCFQAMGKHAFYLGEVGSGSKMNLIVNMILGTTLGALAEAMALADRAGLSQKDLMEILGLGFLNCPIIIEKGQAIIEGTFGTNMPLQHMQKDLCLALEVGDQLEQPLPLAAAANEVYKHAKRFGYGDHDVSAVYLRARF